jgi:hypothetical protein
MRFAWLAITRITTLASDVFGRDATDDHPWLNVPGNDRIGADDRLVSDRHTWADVDIETDPYTITDHDVSRLSAGVWKLSVGMTGQGVDAHIVGYRAISADDDIPPCGTKGRPGSEVAFRTESDLPIAVKLERTPIESERGIHVVSCTQPLLPSPVRRHLADLEEATENRTEQPSRQPVEGPVVPTSIRHEGDLMRPFCRTGHAP